MPKVKELDVASMCIRYANGVLEEAAESIASSQKRFAQNELVLRRLVEAGFLKPKDFTEYNVRWGLTIELKRTVKLEDRTKILGRLHGCIGSVRDDGKSLVNAKRRIISVSLKMAEYPDSTVQVSYLRPFTAEEEAGSACKIQDVVVQYAQPAQVERKEKRLVCVRKDA